MDYFLFQQLNQLATQFFWLDTLGIFFAKYFGYILIISVFFVPLFYKKAGWKLVLQAFSAAILARFGIVELIRWFWSRPRPFVENNVNLLIEKVNQGAFPSGHAAFYFALSTVIFLYYKKVYPASKFWCGAGIGLFVASFLICLGRVFCGVHWPSDILAGALVGVFSGWLIFKISKKF